MEDGLSTRGANLHRKEGRSAGMMKVHTREGLGQHCIGEQRLAHAMVQPVRTTWSGMETIKVLNSRAVAGEIM